MTRIDVPPPLGGLSEDTRFAEQPGGYTRDEQNIRAQDDRNGRGRIAQRPGLKKYNQDVLENGYPVKHMQKVTSANRKILYSTLTNTTNIQFQAELPSKTGALVVRCDAQGNAWTVDGDGQLLVYTADGTEVARTGLPIQDTDHEIRALWVTPGKQAYIGTSSGGSQVKSRLWKYRLDADKNLELAWELGTERDTEGVPDAFRRLLAGYVEDLREQNGVLYTVQNDTLTQRAFVVAYSRVNTAIPELAWAAQCAYPVNSLAVNDAGEVYASSPPNANRGAVPNDPYASPVVQDWTPDDLSPASDNTKRIWAWLRASDIDAADGDDVTFWEDRSGGGRHLYAPHDNALQTIIGGATPSSPRIRANVISGRPAVEFPWEPNPSSGDENNPGMMSAAPFSSDAQFADDQKTLLPTYTGAQFACFMVVKLSDVAEKQGLLVQAYEDGDGTGPPIGGFGPAQALIVNKDATAPAIQTASPSGVNAGRILADFSSAVSPNAAHGNATYPGGSGGNRAARDGSFTYAFDSEGTNISATAATNTLSSTAVDFQILGVEVGDTFTLSGSTTTDGDYTAVSVTGGSPSTIVVAENIASDDATAGTNSERIRGAPNQSRVCIISWVQDGGDPDSVTSYSSRWRINGRDIDGSLTAPADSYNSQAQTNSRFRTYLGNAGKMGDLNPSLPIAPFEGHVAEIVVVRESGANKSTVTEDEIELFEGYLAWAYGRANLLPGSHAYALDNGPPAANLGSSKQAQLLSTDQLVAKFGGTSGDLRWVYSGAGVGYGTAWADGSVFCTGPHLGGDTTSFRSLVDKGDSVGDAVSAFGEAWEVPTQGEQIDYQYPRLDTDKFNNVWIPYYELNFGGGAGQTFSVACYAKDPRVVGGTPTNQADLLYLRAIDANTSSGYRAHAVAVDPVIPEYGADLAKPLAQHVYVATRQEDVTSDAFAIHRLRAVRPTLQSGAARRTIMVGIANGNPYEFDGVQIRPLGSATLASQATLIQSTVAFGKAYFVDGRNLRVYNPDEPDSAQRFEIWKATGFGQIPSNCQLITTWAGRVVLARAADSPNAWFLSKNGDPNDWDTAPPVPRADQAVAGSTSFAGPCPDSITALIPYTDDFLIMGCDASIWMLVGNPVEGGTFENVSQDVGMALGSPWTRDPNGALYFFGSTGGVYRMVPGQVPVRISQYRIEADLSDVDLTTSAIRMVWSKRSEGLWIVQVPRSSTDAVLRSWFYDLKRDGWHRDLWGDISVQPHSVVVLDGDDPDDRTILLGCNDGYVRQIDPYSKDDDGYAIVSELLVGPIQGPDTAYEYGFSGLEVTLGRGLQGCDVQWFGEEDPEELGTPRAASTLHAGQNRTIYERVRGSYCYLKLRNALPDSTWALETLAMDAVPMGDKRRLGR